MLGKILGGIAALIVAIIALGFILPDKVTLEREIVVNAPQEEVFTLVSDFNEWNRWSPWAQIDPDAEFSVSGEGVGHRMEWKSDHKEVGNGMQEITALDAPNKVVTRLDFGDMGRADATISLTPVSGGTKVVWSFESNMREGVPGLMKSASTYMGFFMDGMIGPSYEEGLANLKREAEKSASEAI